MVRRILGEAAPAMPLAAIRSPRPRSPRCAPGSTKAPGHADSAIAKARWDPPLELVQPAVPPITWAGWSQPLDRFTAAYLAKQGVAQPLTVNSAEFARRAYLDIWGLLPTPEDTRAFVADPDPAKRAKLVAQLLDNPTRYSEHWISWWNDLLRNDEGVAYISEIAQRKTITPWLLDALEKNKPYDQMVRELLNPTTSSDPEGFLIGVNWRGTVSASQTPPLQVLAECRADFSGLTSIPATTALSANGS